MIDKKKPGVQARQEINERHKDKYFLTQEKRTFVALFKQPKTMKMVEVETGIDRANVCRYIDVWKERNCIRVAKKGICPITKHRAGFYTTNPALFSAIVEPSNTVKL